MKVIKSILRAEVTYEDEMKNKYFVKKEWDKSRRKALILMKNNGRADEIVQDQTTMYVMNNIAKLDYGSVIIINLFPSLDISTVHIGSINASIVHPREVMITAILSNVASITLYHIGMEI